jgi:ankyrin repeat protein
MNSDKMLLEAIANGDLDRIRQLVTSGANLKARDNWQRTPLIRAAYGGINNAKVIRCLLQGGSAIDATSNTGNTALMEATLAGNLQTVRILLNEGADPALTNRNGATARELASGEIAKMLDQAIKLRGRST